MHHEWFHFIIGASIACLFFKEDKLIHKIFIVITGGMAAVAPDVPKYFGDLLGHSIWFSPLFGLGFAGVFCIVLKQRSFLKASIAFTATVLIGHLLLDALGNGNNFFYPLTMNETEFELLPRSDDDFLFWPFAAALLFYLFFKSGRKLVASFTILAAIYLGTLGILQIELQQKLAETFKDKKVLSIDTFRHQYGQWDFIVFADGEDISGKAPLMPNSIKVEKVFKRK